MTKKCRACCEIKPIVDYGVDKGFKDGYKSKCKICLKNKNPNICEELSGESKVCKVCDVLKDLNQFKKRKNRSYKFEHRCKTCAKEGRRIDNLVYKNGLKKCSSCQEYFELDNFNKYSYKIESACRKCVSKRNKKYRNSLSIDIKVGRKRIEYLKHREQYLKRSREWSMENREKIRETNRKYSKNLKNINLLLYLKRTISSNVRMSLKGKKKNSTHIIIGCTINEFKNHIEKQFLKWMTWENYGNNKHPENFNESWDFDHIIPIAFAKTEEDIIKLNHWSNFQPLCSKYNRYIKRDTIPIVSNIELKINTIKNFLNNE